LVDSSVGINGDRNSDSGFDGVRVMRVWDGAHGRGALRFPNATEEVALWGRTTVASRLSLAPLM